MKNNGMHKDCQSYIDRTNKYIKPLLNSLGYDMDFIRGKDVRTPRTIADYKNWSMLSTTFLEKGRGLLVIVWQISNPTRQIIAQPFVIKRLKQKYLKSRPRITIPHDISSRSLGSDLIPYMLGICDAMNIYYFIVDEVLEHFALGRFADHSAECWTMDNRGGKNPNRLNIKAENQIGLFNVMPAFPQELDKIFNQK